MIVSSQPLINRLSDLKCEQRMLKYALPFRFRYVYYQRAVPYQMMKILEEPHLKLFYDVSDECEYASQRQKSFETKSSSLYQTFLRDAWNRLHTNDTQIQMCFCQYKLLRNVLPHSRRIDEMDGNILKLRRDARLATVGSFAAAALSGAAAGAAVGSWSDKNRTSSVLYGVTAYSSYKASDDFSVQAGKRRNEVNAEFLTRTNYKIDNIDLLWLQNPLLCLIEKNTRSIITSTQTIENELDTKLLNIVGLHPITNEKPSFVASHFTTNQTNPSS